MYTSLYLVNCQPFMGLADDGRRVSTAQRGVRGQSKTILKVMKSRKRVEAQKHAIEYVLKGSHVYTDKLASYQGLGSEYAHKVIDYAQKYVNGVVRTNVLENSWSLLKRGIQRHVCIG